MTDPGLPRKVLVIGCNYWPEESGSAPYTTGLAEDLAAHGSSVTVLAAVPHYPQWEVREGYRGHRRVREWRNDVEVIHSRLWVPGHQSALQRALWEATFLVNTLAVRGLKRPDLVLASTPSLSGAAAARIFSRRFGVPYGLVVQDLVGPGAVQSGISGGASVASLVRRAEGWSMRCARGVVVVSEGFVPYVRDLGLAEGRIDHIPNWSDVSRSQAEPWAVRTRLGLPADTPLVVHAGAMGLKQGLEQVVDAARLAHQRDAVMVFVLAGDGSQRGALGAFAAELSNVLFLPQQSKVDYADLLAAADILLVSERPGMVNMSLPGKLTAYLAAGRPIVAAVPPDGATAVEVLRSGAGVVTPAGDPEALVSALLGLLLDRPRMAGLAASGPRYSAERLSRERILEQLRNWLAGLDRR